MPDARCQIPNPRSQIPDTGYQIPDTRYQIPDTRYQIPDIRPLAAATRGALKEMPAATRAGLPGADATAPTLETAVAVWWRVKLEPGCPSSASNHSSSESRCVLSSAMPDVWSQNCTDHEQSLLCYEQRFRVNNRAPKVAPEMISTARGDDGLY